MAFCTRSRSVPTSLLLATIRRMIKLQMQPSTVLNSSVKQLQLSPLTPCPAGCRGPSRAGWAAQRSGPPAQHQLLSPPRRSAGRQWTGCDAGCWPPGSPACGLVGGWEVEVAERLYPVSCRRSATPHSSCMHTQSNSACWVSSQASIRSGASSCTPAPTDEQLVEGRVGHNGALHPQPREVLGPRLPRLLPGRQHQRFTQLPRLARGS